MRKILLFAAFIFAAFPAFAKNLALPAKNPIATISVPDKWKMQEIAYGYSAMSPDGDIFFSAEYATGDKGVERMMKNNTQWMKENKITATSAPKEDRIVVGDIECKIMRIEGKDKKDRKSTRLNSSHRT